MSDKAPDDVTFVTRYRVPKMDCAAEERLVRLALEPVPEIRRLEFDLQARQVMVWHTGQVDPITGRLRDLKLGATVIESFRSKARELPPPETSSEVKEANTLKQLLAVNAVMFLVEVVMGIVAQSTGLLADSLDMLADAFVYGLSLYAVGKAPAQELRAAHLSGWLQMALALLVLAEVARRFVSGSEPESPVMIGISLAALLANITCLALISKHRHGGAHMKASWIFSSNDVLANLGVLLAGVLVGWTGSRFPDLAIGAIIAVVVFYGGIRILRLR